MKKIFGFFIGLLVLIMTFAIMYFASAIYDTNNKIKVEPFFLRDNTVSNINIPKNMADVENQKLQKWLIQKFVTEYFYVVPDKANMEARQKAGSTLYYLASPAVFQEWRDDVAPLLTEMAEKGIRQTVHVFDEIAPLDNSNYLQVDYELKTWYKPNDMTEVPETTRGTLYIDLGKYSGAIEIRQPIEKVRDALLRDGYDPSIAFVFKVESVKVPVRR